ncbi:MAG: hypothetical protein N3E45_00555 [Oscillatoriaceae bacterium SKW80]|nr:hypothetical protein [Oscillatoriaceae bacterium SKYG93]MCX8119319.1 hypothetical protein [Oscillatoriaceae bacterium SKW80]MDW8454786.1 hypothetical protein [Oscillatoriaceae cyanobacterium SKYGB_i_bin93]HIK28433.1 hypothetical protein [Oscillatoriaceae cyanobacterium M7585_C2015_266]
MHLSFLANFSIVLVVVLLLAFALLQWLHIPTGNFLDWVIGGASFWWLVVIVTVPWNIYFKAKEVLAEAEQSAEKGIPFDNKQIKYVRMVASRSLLIALALHVISAITLYALASAGISAIGYIGSAAALLLTFLRPAVRAYEYLAARLMSILKEVKYPREDLVELREKVSELELNVKILQEKLNPEEPNSLVSSQERCLEAIRSDLTHVAACLEDLKITNQAEHEHLSREAKNAIAQLSADSEFLNHVREIIRFFKTA